MITPGGRVGDASPLGKKGGPRRLDDYVRMVAHALKRDHGWPEAHAIPAARSIIAKAGVTGIWGGAHVHVHPQVQAASAAATIHQKMLDHAKRGRR